MKHIYSKKNRALLAELVRTDFKLRYQGSVLGYAWSLLRPLLLFAILYVVFVKVFPLGKGVPHYPVYLLLGLVMWNFFLEMTTQSLGSIVLRGDLIRKIRIPRWIIVLSASISALINLFLNLIVVMVFLFLNHVDLLMTTLWLPLIIIEVYILALGCSLWLAAGYVKYRDLNYIWEVIMQLGFYVTPIIYPMTRITSLTVKKLLLLNPMGQAVQDARYAVVTHGTTITKGVFSGGWYTYIPYIITIVVFITGLLYFKSQAKTFAENI